MNQKDIIMVCENCNAKYSITRECFGEGFYGLRATLIECPLCYIKEEKE